MPRFLFVVRSLLPLQGAALFGLALLSGGCSQSSTPTAPTDSKAAPAAVAPADSGPTPAPPEAQHSSTAPRVTPPKGLGNAQGRILWNGKGASGIEVQLCESISFLSGCSGKTYSAKTDKDGNYTIDKVKPGDYSLAVRVFNSNSFIYPTSGIISAAKFTIAADETLDIRATNLFKVDLQTTSPKNGAVIKEATPKLGWKAYPGAANYEVTLQPKGAGGESQNLKTASTSIAPETPLLNGSYTWKVVATNAQGVKIAETPASAEFKIEGQAGESKVTLLSPAKDASVSADGLKFTWKAHPLATNYQIYLSAVNATTPILSFERVDGTSYTPATPLAAGQYFWSITAQKDGAKVAASELQPFTAK